MTADDEPVPYSSYRALLERVSDLEARLERAERMISAAVKVVEPD